MLFRSGTVRSWRFAELPAVAEISPHAVSAAGLCRNRPGADQDTAAVSRFRLRVGSAVPCAPNLDETLRLSVNCGRNRAGNSFAALEGPFISLLNKPTCTFCAAEKLRTPIEYHNERQTWLDCWKSSCATKVESRQGWSVALEKLGLTVSHCLS